MDSARFRLTPPDAPEISEDMKLIPARRAASVIILREHLGKLQIFVQHRASSMDFAAGAVVFPGGRAEESDDEFQFSGVDDVLASHAAAWRNTSMGSAEPEIARARASSILRTAIREVEEETGVTIPVQVMKPWENFITPYGYPKRFDTFFFVARADHTVRLKHQTTEAVASQWWDAQKLMDDFFADRIRMMLPTRVLINELLEYPSIDAIFDHDFVVRSEDQLMSTMRAVKLLREDER